jgi:hypothetical protein
MVQLDIETFRWTLSAVFQGVAALTAVVGIFLVFLLSDRVTRRDDVLPELRAGLRSFCKTMSDWSKLNDVHREVALAVRDDLISRCGELGADFGKGEYDEVDASLRWRWNRYGLAKKAAESIEGTYRRFHEQLTEDDRKVFAELDFPRLMASDLESALGGMKKQLILPGVLSTLTMLGSIGALFLTDLIFGLECGQAPTCVLLSVLVLLVLTLVSTGWSIKGLLVDWDQ